MKQKIRKQAAAIVCMALLCMGLLCSTASAATLVVIDLADMVDEMSPSVVEVFTETKQVSSWFQEYVTGRPQLGISVAQITKPGMGWQTYYSTPGLYITQSSADNGLKTGDRIVQIDGTTISNAADVSTVLDRYSVGDTVKVVVSRNGKETTVNVKLTEQKPM